jgi:hypothetical protein
MVSSLLENVLNFMRSNVDAGVHAPGQVEHHPTPWIPEISKEVHDFFVVFLELATSPITSAS